MRALCRGEEAVKKNTLLPTRTVHRGGRKIIMCRWIHVVNLTGLVPTFSASRFFSSSSC